MKWNLLNQMYNSRLYQRFFNKYCKQGLQERNEKIFSIKIMNFKHKWLFYFNFIFTNINLFFIKIFLRRKRIAKYAEIIPKILTKKQRIIKTIGFLKKHGELFSLKRHILHKQRYLLYKTIYKNRLNYKRWR